MGAHVTIAQGGENLVRRIEPGSTSPEGASPLATAQVQAEGLPNLLHELVHAVQAGRLDDDYGIDYSAIPFDLRTPAGRAVLWEELACCVVSCAYLPTAGSEGHAEGPGPSVASWFREQLEIQPVFYGMEDDPPAFVERVGRLLTRYGDEVDAVLGRAYAATEQALLGAGAAPSVSAPRIRPSARSLWPLLSPSALKEPA
ncbi:MAG: hypothetical protein AB1Z98_28520 [Nannocystaceae bacterium]